MRFIFDVTEQDYLDFNMFVVQNYKFYHRQKRNFQIMCIAIPWIMAIAYFISYKEKYFSRGMLLLGVLSICFLFFITIFLFRSLPKWYDLLTLRNVKKILFKEGKIDNNLGETNIIFDEDRIHQIRQYEECFMMYEKITQVKQSDKGIYLFTAPATAIILPSRVFSSKKEQEEFLNYINAKLNLSV